MELIIFQKESGFSESFENFLDLYLNKEMKYFASDLLEEGLSPADIRAAILRALTAGKAGGLEIRKHFSLVYSQKNGALIYDCKLSSLGYAMVLLNAPPEFPIVGEWQLKVLRHFIK